MKSGSPTLFPDFNTVESLLGYVASFLKFEGPEYNNNEVKYGATFYNCHTSLDTCCCEVQPFSL
jgi:hypothetical protein